MKDLQLFFKLILITVTILFSSNATSKANELVVFKNVSYSSESEQLAYTEHFQPVDPPSSERIRGISTYSNAANQIIATKHFSFFENLYQPDFEFLDNRDAYATGVIHQGDKYRVYVRFPNENKIREKMLKIPEPVVTDFGIHFFVLANWDLLLEGKEVEFNYVVPKRLEYFKMTIKKIADKKINNNRQITFKIQPNSFIIELISSIVDGATSLLTYNVDTKKLLLFEGVSLVRDDDGNSFKVRSAFEYQ